MTIMSLFKRFIPTTKRRFSYRHFGFGLSVISLHSSLTVCFRDPQSPPTTPTRILLYIFIYQSLSFSLEGFWFFILFFLLVFVHFKQLVFIHSAARAFPLSVWLKHRKAHNARAFIFASWSAKSLAQEDLANEIFLWCVASRVSSIEREKYLAARRIERREA